MQRCRPRTRNNTCSHTDPPASFVSGWLSIGKFKRVKHNRYGAVDELDEWCQDQPRKDCECHDAAESEAGHWWRCSPRPFARNCDGSLPKGIPGRVEHAPRDNEEGQLDWEGENARHESLAPPACSKPGIMATKINANVSSLSPTAPARVSELGIAAVPVVGQPLLQSAPTVWRQRLLPRQQLPSDRSHSRTRQTRNTSLVRSAVASRIPWNPPLPTSQARVCRRSSTG